MRDVLKQPALGAQQGLDLPGHVVEGAAQLADLIAAIHSRPGRELTPAEALDRQPERSKRPRHVHGQQVAQEHDNQQDPEEIGEELERPERRRNEDQEPVGAILRGPAQHDAALMGHRGPG